MRETRRLASFALPPYRPSGQRCAGISRVGGDSRLCFFAGRNSRTYCRSSGSVMSSSTARRTRESGKPNSNSRSGPANSEFRGWEAKYAAFAFHGFVRGRANCMLVTILGCSNTCGTVSRLGGVVHLLLRISSLTCCHRPFICGNAALIGLKTRVARAAPIPT